MADRLSEYYRVRIKSTRLNDEVVAWMSETFSLNVESQWDSPFQDAATNKLGTTVRAAAQVAGVSFDNKHLSSQVWSGSSPMTLTIPLEFVAESDVVKEVIKPINLLMKMTLPDTTRAGFYIPPGPVIAGLGKHKGDQITITIGNFLVFTQVVMTSIESDYEMKMGVLGKPMRAKCNVTFRTFTTITKDELDKIFQR